MNILHRVAAVGILGVLSLGVGSPASAAGTDDAPVEFVDPALTFEYGEYWSFDIVASLSFMYLYRDGRATVTSTGTPGAYKPGLFLNSASSGPSGWGEPSGQLYPSLDAAPLSAGSYSFTLSATTTDAGGNPYGGRTPVPARLTVSKAPLGIDLRAIPDPNRPDAAIVTAAFTGRFMDDYTAFSFYYDPSIARAMLPDGEWTVVISSEDGTVAKEFTAQAEDAEAASFYWTGAEDDEVYVATATFTPSGAASNNFTISPASAFSFTPGPSSRPLPTSTAVSVEPLAYSGAGGFSLPVWAVVVATILLAGLGSLVTVLSVRLRRTIRLAVGVEP